MSLIAVALSPMPWTSLNERILEYLLRSGFTACETAIFQAIWHKRLEHLSTALQHSPQYIHKSSLAPTGLNRMIHDDRGNVDQDSVLSIIDTVYDVDYDRVDLNNVESLCRARERRDNRDLDEYIYTDSRTVVQFAAGIGDLKIMAHLLEKGCDVNQPPYFFGGATALQAAVIGGFIGMVQLLLDNGAYCDAPGAEELGRTALEAAAEHGRLDILALLLSRGARIDGPGQVQYVRAIYFAEHEAQHAVAQYLRKRREWSAPDQRLYEGYKCVGYNEMNRGY